MTLYRATDAADTMDMVAMLIAAYCQHTGMAADTLQSYLQVGQQMIRAHGTDEEDRSRVAGLMGEALSYEAMRAPTNRMRYHRGQRQAEQAHRPEDNPQKLFTEAFQHGLKAKLCDDVDSLDSYGYRCGPRPASPGWTPSQVDRRAPDNPLSSPQVRSAGPYSGR
ncbi:hypothetical protein [Streptomyces sp. NPDC014734]|uniref:hypothetical protein n=1 Tax=Streptomyces sp. NPDC014734 TaxID=3364886 RepID=UPI0036F91DD2